MRMRGSTCADRMGLSAPDKGAARAGARRLKSPAYPHQEPIIHQERSEALGEQQEPPRLLAGEVSEVVIKDAAQGLVLA